MASAGHSSITAAITSAAALLMSLESVFAALFGWLLLHETMTRAEELGCVLVFAAVVISQLPEKKE